MTATPRWYRQLLSCLPASFAAEAERELSEMAEAEWCRGRPGMARVGLSLRLFGDLLLTLTGAWLRVLLGRVPGGRRAALGDGLRRDLHYAWRGLWRTPGFLVVAVGIIGVGIGATTAILSIGNTLLLRAPTGIRAPGDLVSVHEVARSGSGFHSFSLLDLEDLAATAPGEIDLAGYNTFPVTLTAGTEPEVRLGFGVSGSYFGIVGARPLLGRLLTPADDAGVGGPRVAVLSHAVWRDRFASDSGVTGRAVVINGEGFEVVGIAEPGFRGHIAGFDVGVWVPVALSLSPSRRHWVGDRRTNWLEVIGRAPGLSLTAVAERLSVVSARTGREAGFDWDRSVDVRRYAPLPAAAFLPVVGFVGLLLLLGTMVLLISSTNIAGVMMARTMARAREMAVRRAVGAAPRQIVRQLVVESVLLFLIGGVFGSGLAWAATRLLARVDPPVPVPLALSFPLDGRVLAITLFISLAAGVGFALLPALRAAREHLTLALRQDGSLGGAGRVRFRSVLVGAQVAASALLMVMAGLLVRALDRAGEVEIGLDPVNVHAVEFDFGILDYDITRVRQFADRMAERLAALPGVTSVGAIDLLPLSLANQTSVVALDGRERVEGVGFFGVDFARITPGYFATMRIPIVRGRAFGPMDREGAPGAIVINETLAAMLWPGEEALGRVLRWGRIDDGPFVTVVGVARDGKYRSIGEASRPAVYLPVAQQPSSLLTFLVREQRPDPNLPAAARSIARELDPNLPIISNVRYEEVVGLGMLPNRVAAVLATAFGAVGLLLAMVGLYGVLSFLVVRRRREIGIRLALGAGQGAVRRMVLADGLRITGIGLTIGVAAAMLVARAARSLLFGVEVLDPVSVGGAVLLLTGVAALASDLPARRAAATEPAEVLRDD